MNSKIALFPGSFDPITKAHIDIIRRAVPLFDKIYIAIGLNSSKTPIFTLEQRLQMLREVFVDSPSIEVTSYTGLTVSFCEEIRAGYILRGVRSTEDFNFEQAIAQNNLQLNSSVETVLFFSSPGFGHISSTIVRDILKNKGSIAHLVPEAVLRYI